MSGTEESAQSTETKEVVTELEKKETTKAQQQVGDKRQQLENNKNTGNDGGKSEESA